MLLLALWLQYSFLGLHIADEDDEIVLMWLEEMDWFIKALTVIQNVGFFSIIFVGAGLMQARTAPVCSSRIACILTVRPRLQLHTRKANIRTFTGVIGITLNLVLLPLSGLSLFRQHRRLATRVDDVRDKRRTIVLTQTSGRFSEQDRQVSPEDEEKETLDAVAADA